jgi:hypothetical protein
MAAISLIDPYSQQAEEIARRQRMAQALQESGSQVLQMPTTPGVAISPYAGLAKILESGLGAYQEAKAQKDYTALQTDYRNKFNTQLGEMARLISAPAVEGVIGQEATKDIPGWTRPLGLDTSVSGGTEMFEDVAPVQGKPAIPARPALPAGYISAAELEKFDIPEVKQLAMAKYLAQFEPKQVKLGQNERLLEQTGSGPFRELAGVSTTPKVLEPKWEATVQKINGVDTPGWINVNAGADKAASTFVAGGKPEKIAAHWEATTQKVNGKDVSGWINLNAADKAASFVAGAKPAEVKETQPKWEKGQKTVDGKIVYGWYDLSAPNYEASFKAGAVPPTGNTQLIQVTRGGKVYYENPAIVDTAARQAAAIEKEAAPSKKVRLEVTAEDGSTKTFLLDETDPKFAEGFATKGPDYVSITEVNSQGQTVVRQVKKGDPILATGYVKPLDGFLGQLQQAGVPMGTIQSDPKIRDLVDRYFVKTAGGVAPEEAAGFELKKAEVVARLGELGIAIPANIKGLSLSTTPGVLGGTQSSNAAPPAPASAALQMPANKNQLVNGQTYQTPKGEMKWNAAANRFEK